MGLLAISVGAAEDSETLSTTHKFVVFRGIFYMLVGASVFMLPVVGVVIWSFGQLSADDMTDREQTMFRCVGVAQFFCGFLYLQGGRGNSIHFIATIVTFDFILYPIAMLLMYAIGLRGSLCLFKGALDPFWCVSFLLIFAVFSKFLPVFAVFRCILAAFSVHVR